MHRTTLPLILLLAASLACSSGPPDATPPAAAERALRDADRFAAPIEEAHGREAWLSHPALAGHLEVDFGGNTILAGELTFTTSMGRARIDTSAGPSVVWDGGTAWISPADAELPMARFHVLTWPYFVLAPLKLRDPGTRLEVLGEREIGGRTLEAARLTFEPGVGDTPEDWYVVYKDPGTARLHGMAYIVTFGTTTGQAEEEPHAIVYDDLTDVDGALVPIRMRFYMWTEDQGS